MSRVLLCGGASVSLYKACDLASRLTQAGHEVRVALTEAGLRLFEGLAADHEREVNRLLGDLTEDDLEALTTIFRRLGKGDSA